MAIAGGGLASDGVGGFVTIGGRIFTSAGWRPASIGYFMEPSTTSFTRLVDDIFPSPVTVRSAAYRSAPECRGIDVPAFFCVCTGPDPCANGSHRALPDQIISDWTTFPSPDDDSAAAAFCTPRTVVTPVEPGPPELVCSTPNNGGPCDLEHFCTLDPAWTEGCTDDPFCTETSPAGGYFHDDRRTLTNGVHDGGFAVDPSTLRLWMYGGTSGCSDGACSAEQLDFEGVDRLDHPTRRALANVGPHLLVHDREAATWTTWLDHEFEPWRSDALYAPLGVDPGTSGVREAALAATGFGLLNPATMVVPGEATLLFSYGGTVHQDVVPDTAHRVEGDWMDISTWERWGEMGEIGDDPGDHLIQAQGFDVGVAPVHVFAMAGPRVRQGAAIGLIDRYVATLGGLDEIGLPTGALRAFDEFGTVAYSADHGAVHGASAAYDPLGGRAYFVGSFNGSATLRVLELVDALGPARVHEPVWQVGNMAHQFAMLGERGSELAEESVLDLEFSCPSNVAQCWTDRVAVEGSDQVIDTTFEAFIRRDGVDHPLFLLEQVPATSGSLQRQMVLHSPIALAGGEVHRLVVRTRTLPRDLPLYLDLNPAGSLRFARATAERLAPDFAGWTDLPPLGACPGAERLTRDARAWLPARRTFSGSKLRALRVVHPTTYGAVYTGRRDAGCTDLDPAGTTIEDQFSTTGDFSRGTQQATCFHLGDTGRSRIASQFSALEVVQGVSWRGEVVAAAPSGDLLAAQVYADSCAPNPIVGEVLSQGPGDIAAVSTLLGHNPNLIHDRPAILLHRNENDETAAQTVLFTVYLRPDKLDLGATSVARRRADRVHELGHLFMARLPQKASVGEDHSWLVEALPELTAIVLVPEAHQRSLYHGLHLRTTAFVRNNDADPAFRNVLLDNMSDNDQFELGYRVGPYLLAQAFLGAQAQNIDPWEEWRVLDGGASPNLTDSQIQSFFDQELQLPGFIDGRLRGAVAGEPLLGIRSLESPVGTGATRRLVIAQTQTALAPLSGPTAGVPFPAHVSVPYTVGCSTLDDPALAPFGICGATRSGAPGPGAPLRLLQSPEQSLSLSLEPGIGQTATDDPRHHAAATWVALLSGPTLAPRLAGLTGLGPSVGVVVPGARSRHPGIEAEQPPPASTWMLRCDPALGTVCGLDLDGDGAPSEGDCDDADPVRRPGLDDPAPPDPLWRRDSVDLNCDGWPAASFFDVEP